MAMTIVLQAYYAHFCRLDMRCKLQECQAGESHPSLHRDFHLRLAAVAYLDCSNFRRLFHLLPMGAQSIRVSVPEACALRSGPPGNAAQSDPA